jgi:hypothetical protein
VTTEPSPVDLEALLVALVLAPATFSRNRFFSLYADAGARRVRRRASLLRSLVRQLGAGAERAAITPAERGGALLTYEVPALGLKRTAALDALELAVLRLAVSRGAAPRKGDAEVLVAAGGAVAGPVPLCAALRPDPADTPRIERALARLLPDEASEETPGVPAGNAQNEQDAATQPFSPSRSLEQGGPQAP